MDNLGLVQLSNGTWRAFNAEYRTGHGKTPLDAIRDLFNTEDRIANMGFCK